MKYILTFAMFLFASVAVADAPSFWLPRVQVYRQRIVCRDGVCSVVNEDSPQSTQAGVADTEPPNTSRFFRGRFREARGRVWGFSFCRSCR